MTGRGVQLARRRPWRDLGAARSPCDQVTMGWTAQERQMRHMPSSRPPAIVATG